MGRSVLVAVVHSELGNQAAVLRPAELKNGEVSEAVSSGRWAGEGRQRER